MPENRFKFHFAHTILMHSFVDKVCWICVYTHQVCVYALNIGCDTKDGIHLTESSGICICVAKFSQNTCMIFTNFETVTHAMSNRW